MMHYIGFDMGSTNIKAVLTTGDGNAVARTKQEMVYLSPGPDRKEIDPDWFLQTIFEMIVELCRNIEQSRPTVALCFCGATGNTMLLDSDGTALAPMISWLDTRAVESLFDPEEVYDITGWPHVERFPLAHLAWWKKHRPDLYRQASRIAMNNDYLTACLTGQYVLDYSTASTFHLYDQQNNKWHMPFLHRLEIDQSQLSRLTPSGKIIGPLLPAKADALGISRESMVVAGMFDHPAAAISAGVLAEGELLLSCGTSWVGLCPIVKRSKAKAANMRIDPFLSTEGGPWAGLFSFPGLGSDIESWIRTMAEQNHIPPEDRYRFFDSEASQADSVDRHVVENIAKYLSCDFDAKNNLLAGQTTDCVARSLMLGVATLVERQVHDLRQLDIKTQRVTMVGGAAKSRVWPKLIAKTLGCEIQLHQAEYAGAMGAALLASKVCPRRRS